MAHFSKGSKERLKTCHPTLQELFNEVIKHRDCSILEGHRGYLKQMEAFKNKRSLLPFPYSRHNRKPSLAVDVAPYPIDWDNYMRWSEFGGFVLGVACHMGIDVVWGGHWPSFKDYPHWQVR